MTDKRLLCPKCGAMTLELKVWQNEFFGIDRAELECTACGGIYPIEQIEISKSGEVKYDAKREG